jgi:hypothetical protein
MAGTSLGFFSPFFYTIRGGFWLLSRPYPITVPLSSLNGTFSRAAYPSIAQPCFLFLEDCCMLKRHHNGKIRKINNFLRSQPFRVAIASTVKQLMGGMSLIIVLNGESDARC